ncbi:MAG TPA: ABC-F family ATP-binding cassette domain-containing protein [Candidatus Ozemobacteraceae bacterium]|nr:ABC-F family ATP-binding cassette domain-containing protein [Candidatus Ozemobacteraceae bacterium]
MSLQIRNLSKSFSVRTLFRNVTFAVNPGERVALVGNNGSGKSTLMRIIRGGESADDGGITRPRESRVGYLSQEIFLAEDPEWGEAGVDATLWSLAAQAFSGLLQIRDEIAAVEEKIAAGDVSIAVHDRHHSLLTRFERAGGYTWQARMIRILKGLGFPEARFHDPLKTFSGGWQMRAYFARLLLSEPDYLLLDEPTNYLDISSIAFLEEYLATYPGGILMVSHDRYFLDKLATSVVALMPEGARVWRGNYTDFLEAREQWAREAAAAQDRQDRERRRVQNFVERFRYKASKASQVQSRIKQLEKLERIDQARTAPKLDFDFPPCQESGELVAKAEKIGRRYGEHVVLDGLDFTIRRGDRLAIIGENGAGKTTLMRILAGQDTAHQGRVEWGYKVRFGYFAQDEEISFEKDETIWDRMMRDAPFDMVPQLRSLLGVFLFSGDDIEKPVKVLSGGEKSRLGLARLMLRPCNLLMLDEPTNHLDISSREALLEALDAFPGTLIIVSHDRFFLDCLATRILAIRDGKAFLYEGNYSQYLWALSHRIEEETVADSPANGAPDAGGDRRNDARDAWKERKRQSNQRQRWERELREVEETIGALEARQRDLEAQLAEPPAGISRDGLADLSRQHGDVGTEIGKRMERWEELQKLMEEAPQNDGAGA